MPPMGRGLHLWPRPGCASSLYPASVDDHRKSGSPVVATQFGLPPLIQVIDKDQICSHTAVSLNFSASDPIFKHLLFTSS
jgi:hypothetical protein